MTEDATKERTHTGDEGIEETLGEGGDQVGEADQVEQRARRRRETPEAKLDRVTAERLQQAKEVAGSLRHQRGCPDEGNLPGEPDSRVEHFPATKPATANTPEEALLTIRCSRCGEAEVVPDESEA